MRMAKTAVPLPTEQHQSASVLQRLFFLFITIFQRRDDRLILFLIL